MVPSRSTAGDESMFPAATNAHSGGPPVCRSRYIDEPAPTSRLPVHTRAVAADAITARPQAHVAHQHDAHAHTHTRTHAHTHTHTTTYPNTTQCTRTVAQHCRLSLNLRRELVAPHHAAIRWVERVQRAIRRGHEDVAVHADGGAVHDTRGRAEHPQLVVLDRAHAAALRVPVVVAKHRPPAGSRRGGGAPRELAPPRDAAVAAPPAEGARARTRVSERRVTRAHVRSACQRRHGQRGGQARGDASRERKRHDTPGARERKGAAPRRHDDGIRGLEKCIRTKWKRRVDTVIPTQSL